YYVYTANDQLAYTIDPLGNVSENDYSTINGLNELTTSRQYLGATYNTGGNTPGNPPTLAELQAWVQGSAVQSTLSQSTRTDYSYDVRGQLATQTQYDTVDASGNGVLTDGTVITTTTYDAQGRLLQTGTETGADRSTLQTTSYAYDGLGRLISKTDPMGNLTSYVYVDNGSSDTLVITQASGLTTTQVRNSAGQIVSTTQLTVDVPAESSMPQADISVTNTTGQAVATIQYQTVQVTDSNGQVQTVSGNFVTLYTYDSSQQQVSATLYATPLTPSQVEQLGLSPTLAQIQALVTPGAEDQSTVTIFNDGAVVGSVAYMTQTFDGENGTPYTTTGEFASMVVNGISVSYATPLTSSQMEALAATPTQEELQSLISPTDFDSFLYSTKASKGGPYATVSNNSLTVTNGNMATTYSFPISIAQLTAFGSPPTLSQLESLIPAGAAGVTTLSLNNNGGEIVFEGEYVDASTSYGSLTNVDSGTATAVITTATSVVTRNYAQTLTATQIASLVETPTLANLQSLLGTSLDDQVTIDVLDGDNRTVAVVGYQSVANNALPSGNYITLESYATSGAMASSSTYVTPLSAEQLASLGNDPSLAQVQALIVNSANDINYLTVVNNSGLTVATVNWEASAAGGSNYVTLYTYNDNGQQSSVTTYANSLSALQIDALGASPTLSQIESLITPSANDQKSIAIYAGSQQVAKVSYQTVAIPMADGTVKSVTGEFAVIYNLSSSGVSEGQQLYTTPLTAAQMAALSATPTLSELQAILSQNVTSQPDVASNEADYDAAGHQVASANAEGSITYSLYDADGDVAYTIDADGNVTGYERDGDGSIIGTTQYAIPLTASQLANLSEAPTPATLQTLLTTSDADRTTTTIYNAAGEVVAAIDAAGNVTTTQYNGVGEVLSTTQYATALTLAQRRALGSAPTLAALQADLVNNVDNRTTLTIYDADGH
ncbi:beta strand repeat-containing protein, partial [Dyella jejuensis]